MGAMLDYSHYTKDSTYDAQVTTALLAQRGPKQNYILPAHQGDEGNDDLAFWGFAVMAAAERNWPQPTSKIPSFLDMAANIFNFFVSKWDTAHCGGGLMWQIYGENPNGLHYKNSVSNGGMFQIAARLFRATGNQTYADWAAKVWDWTAKSSLIDPDTFVVYDGTDIADCAKVNKLSFTYSAGIYLYGAAVMANQTGQKEWADRASQLLGGIQTFFDTPYGNTTNIMWEPACESVDRCNNDMKSFKGYLSRFMYYTALMQPSLAPKINTLLQTSAAAAAKACSGPEDRCGQKWYVGGFDNVVGLGQEMTALETVQGLLASQAPPPLKGDEIKDTRGSAVTPTPSTSPTPTKRSNNSAGTAGVELRWVALSVLAGALLWGVL